MNSFEKQANQKLVTAIEAASILKISRGKVERLQLKGFLTPVSTPHPKYFYTEAEVLSLKEKLTPKKAAI